MWTKVRRQRFLFSLALTAYSLTTSLTSAQTTTPAPASQARLPGRVSLLLNLTEQQIKSIQEINSKFSEWVLPRALHYVEVQVELWREGGKESPDPATLGKLSLEQETTRKQIEAEQQRVTREIQQLLTDAQRAELEVMKQAILRYQDACDALSANLLTDIPAPRFVQPIPLAGQVPVSSFRPFCVTSTAPPQ